MIASTSLLILFFKSFPGHKGREGEKAEVSQGSKWKCLSHEL